MKSKKAEEYINNVSVHYTETCYKNDLYFISDKEAAKAVELAEKEMRENAIEEFGCFLEDYCHEAGIKIGDIEHYIKVFANQLNK